MDMTRENEVGGGCADREGNGRKGEKRGKRGEVGGKDGM